MPPINQGRRRTPKSYFGIRVVEWEKFTLSVIAVFGFVITVTIFCSEYYFKQEFNDQKYKDDREYDNTIKDLKTQLYIIQNTKQFATKEDIEQFNANFKKQQKNEK